MLVAKIVRLKSVIAIDVKLGFAGSAEPVSVPFFNVGLMFVF